MENTDKDLINDAVRLCDKAIRTKDDSEKISQGFREISIELVTIAEFDILPNKSILYYNNRRTPDLLAENDVLIYVWSSDYNQRQRQRSIGYKNVRFDYDKAQKWMDKVIKSLNKADHYKTRIEFNGNRLTVQLKDGSYPVIFTTKSGSNDMRDVFQLLFDNYNKGSRTSLNTNGILTSIAQIRNCEILDLTEGFVKTTIKNIREKLSSDNKISGLIEIIRKNGGYILIVK